MALQFNTTPQTSLTGVSAIGAGSVLDNGSPRANHTLQVVTSAGVSAGVVALQGSNDGQNWFTTTASITTNAASSVFAAFLTGMPFQYVRANVSTGITGGTVSAVIASA